jgi:hypothetical protein
VALGKFPSDDFNCLVDQKPTTTHHIPAHP